MKLLPDKPERQTTRPKVDRRKVQRNFHTIDEHSTERDIAIAISDLRNHFLGVLEKHHPGHTGGADYGIDEIDWDGYDK